MSNFHYYQSDQSELRSSPKDITWEIGSQKFIFKTDNGVFSKDYVDYGTKVFLNVLLEKHLAGPILDMGAGYGPLTVVLAALKKVPIYACEINERACELLKANININQVKDVRIFHSDLYSQLPTDLKFANIVTNPPIRAGKDVVFAIYDGAYERLKTGGSLWVVIQKKQGAPSSKNHICDLFGNCEIVKRDKGYYVLQATKF